MALTDVMPEYPLSFCGDAPPLGAAGELPAGWRLDVDVEAIRAVLDFFDADGGDALDIARLPAFAEMMRHRRELGYVPEPLIDEEGLAWCIVHAASGDPIDALWRWLHPQNLFDLSDLYAHRAEYRRLIERLARDGRFAAHVLGRIAPYAPPDVVFADRLSFAVGWGIRGWATRATGGLNLEHVKDHFERMIPTLVHETFHRLQTRIARPNPEVAEDGFDRMTSYPFDSPVDRNLYRALSYVMLEGSATYVASPESLQIWRQDAKAGADLLGRILEADPDDDTLLNEGLRSNGPFYGLGALLSRGVVDADRPAGLGGALRRGGPYFAKRGLAAVGDCVLGPAKALAAGIARLALELERST